MKLKVVGWAWYDTRLEEGEDSWAARSAIVDDIKAHGYMFSGFAHQEGDNCAPVLNDGKIRRYSQRGWGDIMAEAHGYTGRMDYARFAFMLDDDDAEKEIRPTEEFDETAFTPQTDLNERFELEVAQDIFDEAQSHGEIKLCDLPQLRYLDVGDTMALRCGKSMAEFLVEDVDRHKDLTEDERLELLVDIRNFHNKAKKKRAEEKFDKTPIVLIVKLKSPKK